jgi:RND family efflux transporter MFP subunit
MSLDQLLKDTYVRISLLTTAVIIAGSIGYYYVATRAPGVETAVVTRGPITADITAQGVVSPIENPDLSFVAGGRVSAVRVKVGDSVTEGEVLASLDTGILAANLAAAQAKLQELEAGPRSVDVAQQQTALQSAQQALPETLRTTEAQAEIAVSGTDPLFNTPNTTPKLVGLLIHDLDSKLAIENKRAALNQEIRDWREEVAQPNASAASSLQHLASISSYLGDLASIVGDTKATNTTDAATLAAYTSDVSTARSSVSTLSLNVTNAQSALQSAQNALTLTQAGARPEDIAAARAAVDAAAAQLRQAEVIAPFSGVVGSVAVKVGDVVPPNSRAISLIPSGTFELPIYVSEVEVTKVAVGDSADITLDAYGSGRTFKAAVASIDSAPTPGTGQNGTLGYKVTLTFNERDPAVAVGMHGNATVHTGSKGDALLIPRSAVFQEGLQTYVLKQTPQGVVKTPVVLGLLGTDSVEVISGLSEGERVVRVGTAY